MRASSVLILGALAMHWLCYLPGGAGGPGPGDRIHSDLAHATPLLLAACLLLSLASFAVGNGVRRTPGQRSFEAQAASYAVVLLLVFFAQEAFELFVVGPGLDGSDSILSVAGWLVVPTALLTGAFAALAARALDRVEHQIKQRPLVMRPAGDRSKLLPSRRTGFSRLATLCLVFGFARRPPPTGLLA